MKKILDDAAARSYAQWFRVLADPTRLQILTLIARSPQPLPVTSIVAAMDVVQATVSHHLKALAGVGFVVARQQGTRRLYAINEECVRCFPSVARVVMGLAEAGDVACSATDGETAVAPVTSRDARAACTSSPSVDGALSQVESVRNRQGVAVMGRAKAL